MRMKILVISDIHNDVENLVSYLDKVDELEADVVVCPGDFTDSNLPKKFTRIEMAKLILEVLRSLGKPIVSVPGNQDKEIIPFLEKEGVSVHGVGKIVGGVGFYGFGGAKTPFGSPYEPDEDEIEDGLKKAYNDVKNIEVKVQVTHNPPSNTKLDMIPSGAHVGSDVVRKFIEEKGPVAAVCAHLHESRGVDTINNSKIINSGRFPEGYCGLVEIQDGKATAKTINLI
jgi:Icc-related predicted phosphoesterase